MQKKAQKMKEEDEENVIAKSGEQGVGTAEAFKDEVSTEAAELSRFFPPDSGNTEQRRWSKRDYLKWLRSRNDIKASPSLILFCK